MLKRFVIGLLLLLIVLVPLVGCQTPTEVRGPAAQPAAPTSTADLQKQIDSLSRRMKDLEGSVSALESKVGGTYSFGVGSLGSLEERVRSLERQVSGQSSFRGDSLESIERRVSALESKLGGGGFRVPY